MFDDKPVDDTIVEQVLAKHWPEIKLGARLKASQNVTYAAEMNGEKVIVRATATPDCESKI